MAFNFNWSPLTADADFYRRARDLLTKALNKSPKPPIIVDDILVSEFNLGTVPPDLEILEIGDLAEDRFRGIFKMCYSGDAYLTLKTRVQANPLNTYLDSKPSFTSPQPLAAASGLTIPLSITLSEIKLSAFIILVFSKQKGLTLVFRNDPLESLKVSSTFDSIQFVRDYLQRTIEQQLRNLMMDELPAIIHRLSLQLWCPDQAKAAEAEQEESNESQGVDPFESPPLDPVDANGVPLDASSISELTLHGGGEIHTLFSRKNLLRLAALTDSHRTLSLFTPGIRDVVFRAWSSRGDRSDTPTPAFASPTLTKTYAFPVGSSTTHTFSDPGSSSHGPIPSRPSFVSVHSASSSTGLALGHSHHRTRSGRKRKNRVVDLRKSRADTGSMDEASEDYSDTASSANISVSEPVLSESIPEHSELELPAPSSGSSAKVHFGAEKPFAPPEMRHMPSVHAQMPQEMDHSSPSPVAYSKVASELPVPVPKSESKNKSPQKGGGNFARGPASGDSETSSVILEQAWIAKMAGEIARRVYDEKQRRAGVWDDADSVPPPAYEATTH